MARRLHSDGKILPLEVLVTTMRAHWEDYLAATDALIRGDDGNDPAKLKLLREARLVSASAACAVAEKAAPYMHSKLATLEVKDETRVTTVARVPEVSKSVEEWQRLHAPAVRKDLQ